ncbi:uncharacterized protein LOC143836597 isoform X9 [Paroedura picta]|uniref:uncharacterized protein LOC143836597 isoform X9 n=1 Tax=Paroedura picta TaxID=143630 RepID=UPI004057849E
MSATLGPPWREGIATGRQSSAVVPVLPQRLLESTHLLTDSPPLDTDLTGFLQTQLSFRSGTKTEEHKAAEGARNSKRVGTEAV